MTIKTTNTYKNITKICILVLLLIGSGCSNMQTKKEMKEGINAEVNIIIILENANEAYLQNNWIEAEKFYSSLIKILPRDEYSHYRLANAQLRQQKYKNAIDSYRAALKINSDFLEARNNLSTVYFLLAENELKEIERLLLSSSQKSTLNSNIQEKRDLLHKLVALPYNNTDTKQP